MTAARFALLEAHQDMSPYPGAEDAETRPLFIVLRDYRRGRDHYFYRRDQALAAARRMHAGGPVPFLGNYLLGHLAHPGLQPLRAETPLTDHDLETP